MAHLWKYQKNLLKNLNLRNKDKQKKIKISNKAIIQVPELKRKDEKTQNRVKASLNLDSNPLKIVQDQEKRQVL